MESKLYDDKYELINEEGKVVAEIHFPKVSDGVIDITHTFVDDSLRGQGIASKLVEKVIEVAKERNLKIQATCSYAVKYFEKHPNDLYIYRDINPQCSIEHLLKK